LHYLGAKVSGLALDPKTDKDIFVLSKLDEKVNDFRGDIRNHDFVLNVFNQVNPDIVFHLAAQPLVSESYLNPLETYEINVNGTIHILEALKQTRSTKVGIFITTDKVYMNQEKIEGYVETDPLGGYDPYSSSKAAAEIVIESWRSSYMNPENFSLHGKSISSVRAGNVIGGGDWSKDRLVPDVFRAVENNQNLEVRNPDAIRPWQHVLDPLFGYLLLAKKMWDKPKDFCGAWNFGPDLNLKVSVLDMINRITRDFGFDKLDFKVDAGFHETKILALNSNKSIQKLNWNNSLNLDESLNFTVDWYNKYKKQDVYELSKNQIIQYMSRLII
jgi:CDP-glucose 4,6-dehydratase